MRYKCISLLIAVALLSTAAAIAADEGTPSIKASINKKRIFIGDRVRYKVEINSRYNLELEYPQFKDSKIGDCEIKDSGKSIKKSFFRRRTVYTNWFDITSYYVGKRKVPSIMIKYRQPGGGDWKEIKTGELILTVESVLPRGVKLVDIKDIKPPIHPFSPLKLIAWIGSGLILLWMLFTIIKKLWKKTPPKLPYQIALDELGAAGRLFASNGDIKEYYVRVSDTVRRYIEAVFSLRAPEMTTQEFLTSLSDSQKLSIGYKDLLKSFMEACDLVKFAKHAPSRAEIDSVLTTAKKFIEETKEAYVHI